MVCSIIVPTKLQEINYWLDKMLIPSERMFVAEAVASFYPKVRQEVNECEGRQPISHNYL